MRRTLVLCISSAVMFVGVGLQTVFTQEKQNGIASGDHLGVALASRQDDERSFTAEVANQSAGNGFGVDFTFNGYDGSAPTAALIQDAAGNLYGTTSSGGYGLGVVFKLDTANRETLLHVFQGPDGAVPNGALVLDAAGNLYGTTSDGGASGLGSVFKIDSNGV